MKQEGSIEKGMKLTFGVIIAFIIILMVGCGGCMLCVGGVASLQEQKQER